MKNYFLIISCLSCSLFSFGQVDTTLFGVYDGEDFEFGRFYIQVYIPSTFTVEPWKDSVVLLKNNQQLLKNLEEGKDYTIQTKVIEMRPEFTNWQIGEPQFDTIIEKKMIAKEKQLIRIKPMVGFRNRVSIDSTEIFPKEATFKFIPIDDTILVNAIQPCMSVIEYTPIIGTMVEIPPTYEIHKVKIIKKRGKWFREIHHKKRLIQRKKVIFKHVEIYPEHLPQILDTFQIIHFSDSTLYQKANYSVINQKIMSRHNHAYFSEWREYLCYAKDSPILVLKIQEALRGKGYELDLTNEFDAKTKHALIQFQKKNNLPQELSSGKELMKILGINDF
ncbi:MAG: peptidoglycan-binding protein [Saprospiraceae bacterium]